MKDFEYYGLFLDNKNKMNLLRNGLHFYPKYLKINEEMAYKYKDYKFYLDHCTLLHKSQLKEDNDVHKLLHYSFNDMLGDSFKIEVDAIGYSDKALAFRVKELHYCANHIPHITITTFNGGTEEDSENITKWESLDEPIEITGTLKKV